jgi:hypothetical protein
MLAVSLPEVSFGFEDTEVALQISNQFRQSGHERTLQKLTGSATDSRWPQSMTRPVILPTAMRANR